MRHESCLTSFPWMPSEAVTGAARAVFGTGPAHYDNPTPGEPGALEGLRQRTGSVSPTFCGPGSRRLTLDSWSLGVPFLGLAGPAAARAGGSSADDVKVRPAGPARPQVSFPARWMAWSVVPAASRW